jgi:NAD-dependent deacetylase
MLRPGVVWFGEPLPRAAWDRAQQATCEAEVLLVVGTSATVYPAAGLVPMARNAGARVIECNMEETPFSSGLDRSFRGRAGELLPQLMA